MNQNKEKEIIQGLKVAELKARLQERGLPTKGKKNELVERLLEHSSTSPGAGAACVENREKDGIQEVTDGNGVVAKKRPLEAGENVEEEPHAPLAQGWEKKSKRKPPSVEHHRNSRVSHIIERDEPWREYISSKEAMTVNDVIAIYSKVLGGGSEAPSASQVQQLEFHGYLENCLAEILEKETSQALDSSQFVCSVILILNEKFQQSLPSWGPITDREGLFEVFFTRVLKLLQNDMLSQIEIFHAIKFVSNAVQSLENVIVRSRIMKVFGLSMWIRLQDDRRQIELQSRPELIKKWRSLLKKDSKLQQKDSSTSIFTLPETTFFPWLVDYILNALRNSKIELQGLRIVEVAISLCIDALSQLPTRRFALIYLKRCNFVPKARCSSVLQNQEGKNISVYLSSLSDVMDVPVDSLTGEVITPEQAMREFYGYTQKIERLFFNYWEVLRDISYLSSRELASSEVIEKYLARLSDADMKELVCNQLKLATNRDFDAYGRQLLNAIFMEELKTLSSAKKAVEGMSLYPTEKLITDKSLIPEDKTGLVDFTAAIPKINIQFLSLSDYFERNFFLYLTEVAYDVRGHLVNVIRRLAPYLNDCGKVDFSGWSKLGTSIENFALLEVRPPKIGWEFPSYVSAEVSFTTQGMQSRVREEWDQLQEHDLLMLICFKENIRSDLDSLSDIEYIKSCVRSIRGCEIRQVLDEEGNKMNAFTDEGEWVGVGEGFKRTVTVEFDPIQYHMDVKNDMASIYSSFDLIVRRNAKENNFKSVLKSIRDALMSESISGHILPSWLTDTFLGYGDPKDSTFLSMLESCRYELDFQDTFISKEHLHESFPNHIIEITGNVDPPYKINFCSEESLRVASGMTTASNNELKLIASPSSYSGKETHLTNDVRFTPVQVNAITRSLQPGLSLIVGPPGSGKTDTAVQILHTLYHNNKNERTLIITHSNQALNDIFQKLSMKDINVGEMLRLGYGENLLETEEEYGKIGRVNAMLERRLKLLQQIQILSESLGMGTQEFTCETSMSFWKMHILPRWEKFQSKYKFCEASNVLVEYFPFRKYLEMTNQDIEEVSSMVDLRKSFSCIPAIFDELEGLRPFEVLTSQRDRIRYMLTKQAKVIAMTCTHAAIKRQEFLDLDFSFDNIVMEEAAQVLDIESVLPITMQKNKKNERLKRIILIGDHNQLPPVVTNPLLKSHCRFEQSLFARLIRLNTPYVELNAQGRSRPMMTDLYRWRYLNLTDLPRTSQNEYALANPGFAFDYQFIDVGDFLGKGEIQPMPYFYQNLGEAEYLVLVYQYMRLLGYEAGKISVLTTYNGQCELLRDVFSQKCSKHPLFGVPSVISTVDKFQGQQNDYILLSLVRSKHIGHLRDVRRLVVALSRSRLGLYVFGRQSLFQQCQEIRPSMEQFLSRPPQLALVDGEHVGMKQRRAVTNVPGSAMLVQNVQHMANIVRNMEADWRVKNRANI